uniref:Double-stranded RNA-binding protein Staufen homolog 1 n=1 Tax=Gouania willdenowi TaxID=441366 RepID=A0A8C5GJI5_GOUWI
MSQLKFQCPGSPISIASTPLQLGSPQPSYNIPDTIPSESSNQPMGTSGLPQGSASAYSNTTSVSNMANPKEKTPMCLVNELARFNKIQPEYQLLCEQGPAHSKIFSVRLTLGDQHWEAEGTSIKKAQHSAAMSALAETTLPKPSVRPPRSTGRNTADGIAHTMELNALCMRLGKKPMYKPLDPYPTLRPPHFNYNGRGSAHYQRSVQQYYYPFPPMPSMLYHMELSIGGQQFVGKGRTRQLARHDAAAKALKILQKEPILQQLPMNGEPEEENLNKSEISQVFEIALKRNLPVNFEVLKEEGPPHMKSFLVCVFVGEFTGEGEGKSKKIAKKLAASAVLGELKRLPHIPSMERTVPRIKKKTKSIIKVQTSPEYGQGMNPISRLAQIQQAKKEKEPEYMMVTERGMPRRREFVMQVSISGQSAEGMGPSKKVAKRNAAEKMLELLGYKVPQPQPPKPALKTDEKVEQGNAFQATLCRTGVSNSSGAKYGNKEEDYRLPYMSHQQLPAGILPMVPEVAQAVGVCQVPQTKDYNRSIANPGNITVTAIIANELLYAGASMTAEAILKNKNNMNQMPHGPLTRRSEQLGYLASVQSLQVDYKDFPKNNRNEFVSLINCSSQPPLISHGIGKDVESCHDMAALNILKMLAELDQQSNERTGNGPVSGCGKPEVNGDLHLKQANSSPLAPPLDGNA